VKGGMIVTGSGLVFATAADQKIHVYRSADGTELTSLPLGGPTSGQPAMYELDGRQFLIATAATKRGTAGPSGPTGLIAYAIPRRFSPSYNHARQPLSPRGARSLRSQAFRAWRRLTSGRGGGNSPVCGEHPAVARGEQVAARLVRGCSCPW